MTPFTPRRFACELGWPLLVQYRDVSPYGPITWYESGRTRHGLWLQINTLPCWCVCAYALRFGIVSGWYVLAATEADSPVAPTFTWDELQPRLHYRNFANRRAAARFRRHYPECTGIAAERIDPAHLPYRVAWQEAAGGDGAYVALRQRL